MVNTKKLVGLGIVLIAALVAVGCKSPNSSSAQLKETLATSPAPGAQAGNTLHLISAANENSLDLQGDTFAGTKHVIAINVRGAMLFDAPAFDKTKNWYDEENQPALIKIGKETIEGANLTIKFPDGEVMKLFVTGDHTEFGDGRTDFDAARTLKVVDEHDPLEANVGRWKLIAKANERSLDLQGDTFAGPDWVIAFNVNGAMLFVRALYDLDKGWYDNEGALAYKAEPQVDGAEVKVTFPNGRKMHFRVTGQHEPFGDGRTNYDEKRSLIVVSDTIGN